MDAGRGARVCPPVRPCQRTEAVKTLFARKRGTNGTRNGIRDSVALKFRSQCSLGRGSAHGWGGRARRPAGGGVGWGRRECGSRPFLCRPYLVGASAAAAHALAAWAMRIGMAQAGAV